MSDIIYLSCQLSQFIEQLGVLHEVIQDILLFLLKTERCISSFWLLRYLENNFIQFRSKLLIHFLPDIPKTVFVYIFTTFHLPELDMQSKRAGGYILCMASYTTHFDIYGKSNQIHVFVVNPKKWFWSVLKTVSI